MNEKTRASDSADIPYQHGVPLDTALARRERLADKYDIEFGQDRVFPELIEALLDEVPQGANVIEVGAATGILTRPLLEKAGHVTALEPSDGLLRILLSSRVSSSPHLSIKQGMVEDLLHDEHYEVAVVTFTPRRGIGLMRLLTELVLRVDDRVVMLLDEDASMDWAYLARGAAAQGFGVSLKIVTAAGDQPDERRRAVVLVAECGLWTPSLGPIVDWGLDARELTVPYPAPRGSATRLVRYFLAGGDRAVLVMTDPEGLDRLYGNLRTAVHRLGRDELTVRRQSDSIQLVRLPRGSESESL